MNSKYWDSVAKIYEEEVFDALRNDKKNKIIRIINEYSSNKLIAGDFGCGIGRYLPVLSKRFNKVLGIDFSRKCLHRARLSQL